MTAYTSVFGGNTVYPAQSTYRAFSLSANVTLEWPTESVASGNVVAAIMDVTPTGGGFTVRMPPANQASTGDTALFFNVGGSAFTVADNSGNTIVSVGAGQAWQVYLTGNATVNGTWRATQYGAGTSTATAGSLIGAGIKAVGTTLNQTMSNTTLTVNYTAGDADRSEVFNWAGGAGTITLPSAATVGSDWFIHARNSGTGGLTLATSVGGQSINGASTLILNPGDSCIVFCDGSNFFTVGLGKSASFAFDFVSINLTGQPTPYVLSGANLNRVSYRFTGALTFNMQIVVPNTVQQYWIANETDLASAPYSITVKTLAGTGVAYARNERGIAYCDGTNVIDADTGGISLPLSIAQGGTGATTDTGARVNLGGTATGISLFTAPSASSARSTLGSTVVGDNLFTLANPSAVTFLRVNADNTVSALDAASFRTAIGTGAGTVTSVSGAGTVNGLTLTGTVTSSGSLTLGGTLTGVSLTTAVTGTLPIANGGTGATTTSAARTGLGATTVGANIFTLTNPSAITFLTINADNTVSTRTAAQFRTDIGVSATGADTTYAFRANNLSDLANAATARTNLGATTVGGNIFTLTNPSAIAFLRVNADNTVSALDAATFRTAVGAGTGNGTVTSVGGTGTVNGLTLTGTVTGSGNLTLGGTLSGVDLGTQTTGTLAIGRGGTGVTTTPTNGQLLIGNGTGYTVASLTAGSGITITPGAGSITIASTGGGTGTVTSVDVSGGTTGLTFSGGPITSSGTITMAGTLAVANGGTGSGTAAGARTNLGATTVGGNLFTLANPSAVRFLQINADNTVSALDAASMRSAIGAGTGSGSVTSVDGSGGTTGLTLTGGPITGTGTLTLGGTLAVANGGTGATTAANARGNLGATTVGGNIFTLTNPSAVSFLTINADNTVSARSSSQFRTDIGLGSLATLNSINNSNWSGTALTVGNGGTGATTLTSGFLVKGNGTSAVSASVVYDDGTNVGIGNSSPGYRLDVGPGVTGNPGYAARFRGNASDNSSAIQFTNNAVSDEQSLIQSNGGGLILQASGTKALSLRTNGVERLGIDSNGVSTFSAGAATTTSAIAAAATTTINCRNSNVFRISMGANITTLTVSNPADGQTINVRFIQDATGSRTVSWPTSFKWPGGASIALSTAANAVDLLVATYFSDTGFWLVSLTRDIR